MAAKKSAKKKELDEVQEKLKDIDEQTKPEDADYVVIPPDGGFGWVVAIAAMLCNLICDGTLFAFGSMKLHIQKDFQCSDMLILMVGAVPCGVYLLVGPIVSGLSNRYGCRPIIIIGSIGSAGCMALSTLSPNVWIMMIVYGIFGGLFFGMVYLPSVVMVSFYFDKYRDIANGLVTAGTGVGVLSFGPLANLVMGKFGWKTGMLIFSGIMLTGVLFGAVMKPLKGQKAKGEREIEMQSPKKSSKKIQDTPSPLSSGHAAGETNVPLLPPRDESARISSTATVPSGDIPPVTTVGTASSPGEQSTRSRTLSSSSRGSAGGQHRAGVADPEDAARPLYKKDALYTGSIKDLHHGSRTSLDRSNPYIASVTDIPAATTAAQKKESAFRAFANILAAMTDFSILKNKQMLVICLGNIFSMLGYYLPIMCLVSFAVEDLKVNQTTASFLMTIFGTCNTIGRLTSGLLAKIPNLNALRVHNALLFVAGISTVLAAYAFNFPTCALYAGLCGYAIAPHMSLLPSVVCKCVGIDAYTTAFGVLFLFRGVTSIIGPPAAGFLKDYTRKYDLAFAIGGAMIIIAAFFHFAVGFIQPDPAVVAKEKENEERIREKNKLDV